MGTAHPPHPRARLPEAVVVEHRGARALAGEARRARSVVRSLVTLAYIAALAAAVAAFDGGVSFAQVGAVYLGASIIAAAAPTPGGLGAMEAALVAGLTGVGMEPGIAVAAVLSYRLADLLAADPAGLAQLPATSSGRTSSSHERRRGQHPARRRVPARSPRPTPPPRRGAGGRPRTSGRTRRASPRRRPRREAERGSDGASAAASANATAECPDTYPRPVACSRTSNRRATATPVARADDVLHPLGGPVRALARDQGWRASAAGRE